MALTGAVERHKPFPDVWGMANCNRNVLLLKVGWPGFINRTNREKGKAKKTWPAADGYLVKKRRASGEDGIKVDIPTINHVCVLWMDHENLFQSLLDSLLGGTCFYNAK
jgi:hypothetical protein